MAVPADVRAGVGVPQGVAGELVPQRSDGARERAGRRRSLRALRRSGHEEEADPVVSAHHGVRRPTARRHVPAAGQLAREGPAHAAQLDRTFDWR